MSLVKQGGGLGIGAGDEDGRDVADIGGEPGRYKFGDKFLGRHEDFAAHMAAFFG